MGNIIFYSIYLLERFGLRRCTPIIFICLCHDLYLEERGLNPAPPLLLPAECAKCFSTWPIPIYFVLLALRHSEMNEFISSQPPTVQSGGAVAHPRRWKRPFHPCQC